MLVIIPELIRIIASYLMLNDVLKFVTCNKELRRLLVTKQLNQRLYVKLIKNIQTKRITNENILFYTQLTTQLFFTREWNLYEESLFYFDKLTYNAVLLNDIRVFRSCITIANIDNDMNKLLSLAVDNNNTEMARLILNDNNVNPYYNNNGIIKTAIKNKNTHLIRLLLEKNINKKMFIPKSEDSYIHNNVIKQIMLLAYEMEDLTIFLVLFDKKLYYNFFVTSFNVDLDSNLTMNHLLILLAQEKKSVLTLIKIIEYNKIHSGFFNIPDEYL